MCWAFTVPRAAPAGPPISPASPRGGYDSVSFRDEDIESLRGRPLSPGHPDVTGQAKFEPSSECLPNLCSLLPAVFQVSRMDSSGKIPVDSPWLLGLRGFDVSLAT